MVAGSGSSPPSQQRLLPSQRVSQGRCVLRSDNKFQKSNHAYYAPFTASIGVI